MSERRSRTPAPARPARRVSAGAASLALSLTALTGCQWTEVTPGADRPAEGPATSTSTSAKPVFVSNLPAGGTDVGVDLLVRLRVEGARLASARLTSAAGDVEGRLSRATRGWAALDRLEPGTDYTLHARATRANGESVSHTVRFRTEELSLDEQTYASVAPLDGETVGVGMPVIVTFDLPVTDRAALEREMTVTSTPPQQGSWHWLDDREVHWRPAEYWQAGTDVSVDLDINGVDAGGGIHGQESRHVEFQVGDAHVYRVDARRHRMKVFRNGSLLRTLPVTLGKPGFTTRSGTKVVIEKFAEKRMNSETVGIGESNPEYYDIDDVQWAMRLTYSGEFIHAAPWSIDSQGSANVSHGCTGMSPADAGWLYAMTQRGDVVEYTGTGRPMTLENGFGDWNVSFAEYRRGSALS
ncbi:Ig-like domain-containing protein [Nocardioides sp.]|uniref:L,D-transpeptidase n=1 Tax=Nocardioides sp. TaxID=35761 RepID=UPI003569DCD1